MKRVFLKIKVKKNSNEKTIKFLVLRVDFGKGTYATRGSFLVTSKAKNHTMLFNLSTTPTSLQKDS